MDKSFTGSLNKSSMRAWPSLPFLVRISKYIWATSVTRNSFSIITAYKSIRKYSIIQVTFAFANLLLPKKPVPPVRKTPLSL